MLAICGWFSCAELRAAESVPAVTPPEQTAQQTLLQWNLDTLVGDYERNGRHNPKWDESAKLTLAAFAKLRAAQQADEKLSSQVSAAAKTAVENGCDDPVIKYLYARFVWMNQEHTSQQHAEMFSSVAEAMSQGERAPIRKFYAALRASEALNTGGASTLPQVHKWRSEAQRFLGEVAHDKTTPAREVYDAWEALLESTARNKREHDEAFLTLEPQIFKNWPSDPGLLLLKGQFYTDYAWEARGTGVANSVTGSGWELFGKRLGVAEAALTEAWKLNPHDERIARRMITVELGQGQGRPRMEQWFERAMSLNPNYYDACYAKLIYLQPKWYGSKEDMLEFASECLNSPKWGGHIPLIVYDTHQIISQSLGREARKEYFARPEVWTDLKQAFDKFFRLNPDETGWHHNYALYAYWARQWDDLNRELNLLGTVNYDYFGGKDEFNKIVQAAKDHAVAKSP